MERPFSVAVLSSRQTGGSSLCFSMDPVLIGAAVVGFFAGWTFKGYNPDPTPPTPCVCHCDCISSAPASSGLSTSVFLVVCCVGLLGLVAHAAWAFKVTVVSGGQEKGVAFSVKGKSKGIYNPSRGFELTG